MNTRRYVQGYSAKDRNALYEVEEVLNITENETKYTFILATPPLEKETIMVYGSAGQLIARDGGKGRLVGFCIGIAGEVNYDTGTGILRLSPYLARMLNNHRLLITGSHIVEDENDFNHLFGDWGK